MHLLLSELLVPQTFPVNIYSDSQAALDIAADPVFHPKTKHFAIDCHFVREQVQLKLLQPIYVPSSLQLADILTKGLFRKSHWNILSRLIVLSPKFQSEGGILNHAKMIKSS